MIQRHKARKLYEPAAQRFALPARGWGRRSRPARKMTRRGKLLGICAESPASGARFVSPLFVCSEDFMPDILAVKFPDH